MGGNKGTKWKLTEMMLMVQGCLLEEFRITSISNLSIEKMGTKIVINCDIVPIAPYPKFDYYSEITE